jgi:hypothetical protein
MAVVVFHYSNSTIPSIKPNPLAPIGEYGKHGVEMFFVISGFVIYLTLRRLRHAPSASDLGKFLLRRSIRVVAPAWASLALTLAVYYGSYYFYKPLDFGWPPMTAGTAACNVFMCCSAASGHWINAVYWTLEVELCFYLSFSVLFYLWRGHAPKVVLSYFAFGVALWLSGSSRTFPMYALTFLVGVLLADVLVGEGKLAWWLPLALASLGIVYLEAGIRSVAFSAAAAVAIYALYRAKLPDWALFLGKVSFSLYLTHTLLAALSESVLKRLLPLHHSAPGKVVMLLVYCAVATAFSYVFYRVVEAPVVRRARAIR